MTVTIRRHSIIGVAARPTWLLPVCQPEPAGGNERPVGRLPRAFPAGQPTGSHGHWQLPGPRRQVQCKANVGPPARARPSQVAPAEPECGGA